jgi:hypothetical protein
MPRLASPETAAQMMNGAIATSTMRGQRKHLIHHQHVLGFSVTRSRSGDRRRQSRTLM